MPLSRPFTSNGSKNKAEARVAEENEASEPRLVDLLPPVGTMLVI